MKLSKAFFEGLSLTLGDFPFHFFEEGNTWPAGRKVALDLLIPRLGF